MSSVLSRATVFAFMSVFQLNSSIYSYKEHSRSTHSLQALHGSTHSVQADSSSGFAGSLGDSLLQGCAGTFFRGEIPELPKGRKTLCEYRIFLSSSLRINLFIELLSDKELLEEV